MNFFHIIDDGFCVLRVRGVFRQAKLYRRGDDVYAGFGSGFIRLHGHNGTSAPNVSWQEVAGPSIMLENNRAPVWIAPPVVEVAALPAPSAEGAPAALPPPPAAEPKKVVKSTGPRPSGKRKAPAAAPKKQPEHVGADLA